jgi:hypothetical protein
VARTTGPTVSDEGEHAPAGTHFEMRRSRGLVIGGIVTLSVSYLVSLMYGTIAFDNSHAVGGVAEVQTQESLYLWYLVPVVGPVVGRAALTAKYGGALTGAFDWVYSVGFSLAQAAGLTMLVLGARETSHLVSDRSGESAERSTPTAPPLRLSFSPGASGTPLGLTLTLEN